MIKHVVCFKLKNPTPDLLAETKDVLMSMDGNVPQLRAIEVGVDFLGSPRSYDIILQVVLEDCKALQDYQNDPYHCDVVKKHMHAVAENSIAIDYDVEFFSEPFNMRDTHY